MFYDFFIFNSIVDAKYYKYITSMFIFEIMKTGLHPLCGRIITKVCLCGNRFNLNSKSLITNPTKIIYIARMIELRIAFYKTHIRKSFRYVVFNNRLLSEETVIRSIYSEIVNIINAILHGELIKCLRPFWYYNLLDFYIKAFTKFC